MADAHLSAVTTVEKVPAGFTGTHQPNGVNPCVPKNSTNSNSTGHVNWAYRHETTDTESDIGCQDDDSNTQPSHNGDEEQGRACGSDTHSIILDISTTSFVDTVTVKTLKNVCVCAMKCTDISLNLQSQISKQDKKALCVWEKI